MPFIAHSCLKGLEYMNDCGFAHLDIKAGNIGYDDFGRIKLVRTNISKKQEILQLRTKNTGQIQMSHFFIYFATGFRVLLADG